MHARTNAHAGEHQSETPAHRDAYGFKLEGKVDWETYSSWQVCSLRACVCLRARDPRASAVLPFQRRR